MSAFASLVTLRKWDRDREFLPWVIVVACITLAFFLSMTTFFENPFAKFWLDSAGNILVDAKGNAITGTFPPNANVIPVAQNFLSDGRGLNPLLRHPGMIIHPPMLYLGFVSFVIPYAFAMAALITGRTDDRWIRITRRWTLWAWLFLSAGLVLGSRWAYDVLGWGGFWGWDPVENASLLPWLTGTAFLHSVMMQEKRGMMKVWNVWLVFITFMLCILGTMLTRSGVVSSVHAFAQSNIGPWFVGFLIVIMAVCLAAYFKNRDYLKSENQLDSMVSRESSFLFNNLVLLVACIAVISGTLFPVFSEWFTGSKISVGAPFFNKVNIPLGLLLLFLTGVGPLLAWRKTSAESLRRNFLWPTVIGLSGGVLAFGLGVRDFYALICLLLCTFVAATIGLEFYRGARVVRIRTRMNWLSSAVELTLRNTRRYGGYIVHFGMVMIFVGLAGQAFNKEVQKEIGVGGTVKIGPYELLLQAVDQKLEKNYTAERMIVEVMKDHKPVMILFPERRNFPAGEESGTMVAIYSTLREDLYVVYAGVNQGSDVPTIHVFLNPLVKWVWFGGIVVVMGTIVALLPSRHAVLVLSGSKVPEAAPGFAAAMPSPVTLKEGRTAAESARAIPIRP
jgi:cytochrome c-type biogenesis protein CcmF